MNQHQGSSGFRGKDVSGSSIRSSRQPARRHSQIASRGNTASARRPAGRPSDSSARPSYQARQQKSSRGILVAAITIIVVALILWAYASTAAKYEDHYFPNTQAFGVDFSEMTAEQAQELLEEKLAGYKLHVTGQGIDFKVRAKDIGLEFNSGQPAQDALSAQNPLLWPFMVFGGHDASDAFAVKYKKKRLKTLVKDKVESHNRGVTGPVDEGISFNADEGAWEYVPPKQGSKIKASALVGLCRDAIDLLQADLEVSEDCLRKPKSVNSEVALKSAVDKANELCSKLNVEFTLAGTTPLAVDAATAAQWIVVSDDYDVSIDDAKMEEWLDTVKSLLSGVQTRTYTRPDGKMCTVSDGSYSGWRAEDPSGAVSKIRNALKKGDVSNPDIPCTTVGNGFLGIPGADWGKRFIDVDIDEQHARFYDESGDLVWESDVITGVWGTDFATPTGVYTINDMQSPASLRSVGNYVYVDENGETQVEEDHVFGRDVDYWMPFIRNFIGFHDAWWQKSFGGNLYLDPAYGSGGCVNLPTKKAKKLYGLIRVGDVVVVHD